MSQAKHTTRFLQIATRVLVSDFDEFCHLSRYHGTSLLSAGNADSHKTNRDFIQIL